ncbi:amidohydrolase family protein [Gordonia sp. N1V]|uniref:amidohydrolase family protein n=1 Tax=Gordonia sp. N1V TaxID=3034163 RepID=UPI0023E109D8|nr:amidohydrolase family protein [Gordonia sp. N1V]MDF3285193.1 amidohydrolase family protein [Gordonia sp. N1V]
MPRIDTHHHVVPDFYRNALRAKGIDAAGGRTLPDWNLDSTFSTMAALSVNAAVLSVSTPGTTFLDDPDQASQLAAQLNDHNADLARQHPDRLGFLATVPTPHAGPSAREAARALDELGADGVTLLANAQGNYLGEPGLDELWEVLDAREAVVFIHPADLPGPAVSDLPPFATDFLLDTSRAAYLLVRNGIRRKYPRIRFLLSHGGGFVPYASHRMAIAILGDTGRGITDSLDEFRTFYFDTALTASPAALPTLLAFAAPGHITFGSDWPFAPVAAATYFATALEDYRELTDADRAAIDWSTAATLFPRFGPSDQAPSDLDIGLAGAVRRRLMRVVSRAMRT